jgi:hypothetical protein
MLVQPEGPPLVLRRLPQTPRWRMVRLAWLLRQFGAAQAT